VPIGFVAPILADVLAPLLDAVAVPLLYGRMIVAITTVVTLDARPGSGTGDV
jgi:hypothetical protein